MPMTRRDFVRTVGKGGAGALTTAFIIARGREELAALGIEGQNPPRLGPGEIRLSGNENPRGPGDAALRALRDRVSYTVGRYPDNPPELQETMGRLYGGSRDNVLMSTGSAGLLAAAVRAYTSPARPLVTGDPSYGAPLSTARRIDTPIELVPVDADLRLDLDRMAEAARGAGLVFVCNPNNPTSTFHSSHDIASFVQTVRRTSPSTAIHIDEAYIDYASDPSGTAAPLALEHPDVFITRTFSKAYGMAGLRLGYAFGRPETIQRLDDAWGLGSVNSFTAAAALASLGDPGHMASEHDENARVRAFTTEAFEAMGFEVPESHTNFLFVNLQRPAAAFREACMRHRVQVGRDFPPMERTHCRISIGTMEEMRRAVDVFREVLAPVPA